MPSMKEADLRVRRRASAKMEIGVTVFSEHRAVPVTDNCQKTPTAVPERRGVARAKAQGGNAI